MVDEGSPSLERAEDGPAAEDVSDGFLRRVPLDAVDAVADDVVQQNRSPDRQSSPSWWIHETRCGPFST